MGVRAIQARIECDRETLLQLWRTHCVFNERLPVLLKTIFRMLRGEAGRNSEEQRLYKTIAHFVLDNSQNAEYLLNAVSMRKRAWSPNSAKRYKAQVRIDEKESEEVIGESWASAAAELSKAGVVLYDKDATFGDIPSTLRQMICRECAAIVNGHSELVANWKKDHAAWLVKKRSWEDEAEHKLYLALRPKFEEFEQLAGGKASKRRGRWHKYLDWLRANGSLASWRGRSPGVHELSTQAVDAIRKAKPWKKRSKEAEEFWRANPELAALDRLHGSYEREFVRRRKTKKHIDGFNHRPTFTLPHAVNHPRWFVFNAPQTSPNGYANLTLPKTAGQLGSIDLLLITGEREGDAFPTAWKTLRFKADPRLADFRRVSVQRQATKGKIKGQMTTKAAYRFFDRQLNLDRAADISGAKLIFKNLRLNADGSLKTAVPYLYFTCTVDDIPITDRAKKIEWMETDELKKTGGKRKKKKLPDGLITCAVDLGWRNLGFATLAVLEGGMPRVLRSRSIWLGAEEPHGNHSVRWSEGPTLAEIARHKRELKRSRRMRGKPVLGERSHVRLQQHVDDMGEDRFKKAARAIVNFALNIDQACDKTGELFPRADVLVLEMLEGFIPDAERERGINRSLAAWNRAQLVGRLKQMADDAGFKRRLYEIHPAGTSQVCSKCGALGRRYSIVRDGQTGALSVRFGWVEKLFACPKCEYRANSDHNASVNLHRKFCCDDSSVAAFFAWKNVSSAPEKEKHLRMIDEGLLPSLERLHRISAFPDDPF